MRSTDSLRSTTSSRGSRAPSISDTIWRLSPISSQPSTPAPLYPNLPNMRRVRSRPSLRLDHSPTAQPPQYRLRAPSLTSSSTVPAPRPFIRRSHASHPDITVLCDNWSRSGPANRTMTYKPDTPTPFTSHPRNRSATTSSFTSTDTS